MHIYAKISYKGGTMEIKRDTYLTKLIDRKGNGQVKIITGVRRCGKSYLLNTLFYNHLTKEGVDSAHIIRFAFDSAGDLALIGENLIDIQKKKRKVNPNKFINYINELTSTNEFYYLLLDEVQELDCFESVLNGYLRKDNIDIYVTGSNAKFLSKDIITEFAGHGDVIHMYPLSFMEFMSVYNGDKYEGFNEYMIYGGIPLVALRSKAEDKVATLNMLFEEIYLKDIYQRNKIRNKGEIEDLLNIISSSVSSLTNPENIKNTFRSVKKSNITSSTIIKYISYIEDAFLLEHAQRYDIKGRKYIETPLKYYFCDTGLRNARINFRQGEETHLMENIIFNELKIRGYNVDVGVVEISVKENNKQVRKQLEIDFICTLGANKYYIQSAYSLPDINKREQEIRPLKKIDDSFKKIIVTKDMVPSTYDENGILTMNIYDFLLDKDSLNK